METIVFSLIIIFAFMFLAKKTFKSVYGLYLQSKSSSVGGSSGCGKSSTNSCGGCSCSDQKFGSNTNKNFANNIYENIGKKNFFEV